MKYFVKVCRSRSEIFTGKISDYQLALPDGDVAKDDKIMSGPKLISTLNSNRLATILQNKGINVVNKPVIELVAKKGKLAVKIYR